MQSKRSAVIRADTIMDAYKKRKIVVGLKNVSFKYDIKHIGAWGRGNFIFTWKKI